MKTCLIQIEHQEVPVFLPVSLSFTYLHISTFPSYRIFSPLFLAYLFLVGLHDDTWRDWKDCDFMASGEGHLGRHVYVKHQKIAIVKLLNMKSV